MKTWWLGHIFGMMGLSYSFLDMFNMKGIVDGMPSGFRYSIIFFSLAYTLFQSLRAYERWQSDRLDNEKKRIEIRNLKIKK